MEKKELDAAVRRERWRVLRDWSLGIGIGACALAVASYGPGIVTNPGAWAPTGGRTFSFVAVFSGAGWRSLAGPLLVVGAGLVVLALLLTLAIGRRQ